MTRIRVCVAASAAVLTLTLAACTGAGEASSPTAPENQPTITVPHRSVGKEVPMRLGEGVIPPTNRWYSSLAFGDPGLPVFPKPLSFAPIEGGFTMGLTRPVASAHAILAPGVEDVTATIDGARDFGEVTHADPVGVILAMGDARISLAQGWPVVGITADADVTITLSVAFEAVGDGVGEAVTGQSRYGVLVRDGEVAGDVISLDDGGSAQLFAVPEGTSAVAFAKALGDPVLGVGWAGEADGREATTTLTYAENTVLTMPAERASAAGLPCELGTYQTIHGEYAVCAAGKVTWPVPTVAPRGSLDLSHLTADERAAIRAAVRQDIINEAALPSDSYFGAKALFRLANLVLIAEELGESDVEELARLTLTDALRQWADPGRCEITESRCFVYDPRLKGMVGMTPSFGSEDFNDHHFHYGYLLHAAAVAAQGDAELLADIGPVLDQVAADIASGPSDAGAAFPPIRAFDPFEGHSWASGFAPFADANNQESSSEAVTAWNGVALWAQLRGNSALEARARWMLSAEAEATRRLWLAPNLSAFPEFDHTISVLEWGSKRDYATWFSAEPAAMLGIQLIPMSPVAPAYLGVIDPGQISRSVAEASANGSQVQFGDYLLMYSALSGLEAQARAWDAALELPDSAIDDANSRAYLLAFVASI